MVAGGGSPQASSVIQDPVGSGCPAQRCRKARQACSLCGDLLASLSRATELDPNAPNAWRNLGVALRAVGDTGGAAMADRRMRKCISV